MYVELQVALQVIFTDCEYTAGLSTLRLGLYSALLGPLVDDVDMLTLPDISICAQCLWPFPMLSAMQVLVSERRNFIIACKRHYGSAH